MERTLSCNQLAMLKVMKIRIGHRMNLNQLIKHLIIDKVIMGQVLSNIILALFI
jgi:hypothetical protein